MRLSASNLELLRTRPQSSRLKLSIFQPRTVLTSRIDNSLITKGARTIICDEGATVGSFNDVEPGMTLLIGSAEGLQDIGKVRVRSTNAALFTITVSENSNIAWADSLYLTVQRYWELWPVYPRIIIDPADDESTIFYKDYDVAYSNQNSILGTFVNAGPHRAVDIVTGSVNIWYSSTGTYNLLGDSLNYNWWFEGGSPTGSSSADPGNISYNTPGHYVTRLTVSGSSGGVDTTYRYVSVYNPANPPITKWEVSSIAGSRDEGGYRASFKVYEDVPIQENAVVVLYADDWYGSTNQSLGGNYPNAEKIFYVGYILKDTIRYDYQQSSVEFETASITDAMKKSLGFSVSVESKATPTKWYELLDLDCRRAIYHYLRWHTTALSIADFQFVGDDRKLQFFDADRNSMFDAIDNLMRNTLIGSVASDRQGKTWMEVHPKAYSNPTGTFSSVMEITKRDWMGEPTIEERLSDELSYIEMGGIAYSGVVTGTFSALLSEAPGNAPTFRGRIDNHEGLALLGQSQLNELAGNYFANENSKYPSIGLDMSIGARNLDIAPQEVTDFHILTSDTVRNLAINGLYIPSSFDWKYDAKNGILLPSADFTSLVNGANGTTIIIPPPEEVDGGGNTIPGLQIPIIPGFTFPPPSTIATDTQITIVINSFMNQYADVGVHNGSTSSLKSSGIRTLTNSTSTGAGTVELDLIPAGLYYVSGHFYINSSSLTPGDIVSTTFQIKSGGPVVAQILARGTVDSGGQAFLNSAAAKILSITPSTIVSLVLGSSGFTASPLEFALTLFRISA